MSSTKTTDIYGNIFWRNEHNQLHREDGPACTSIGHNYWYINGLLHREDGPAIEYADGTCDWYINGIKIEAPNVANQLDWITDLFYL